MKRRVLKKKANRKLRDYLNRVIKRTLDAHDRWWVIATFDEDYPFGG